MRKIILVTSLLVILFSQFKGHSQNAEKTHHAQLPIYCKECHTCNFPTYENPCLKILPNFTRKKGITVHHAAKDAPEFLKIGILSNRYEPTIFTHKLHAEMASMSGGCIFCHHFNPPGRIAPCRDCHESSSERSDLSKPGLKGAYHRQCLNCHRGWSHKNECQVCHALKGDTSHEVKIDDKEKYKNVIHPKISEPDKKVYQTDYDELPLVTFYHNTHITIYGYGCINCHENETCARCHDTMKITTTTEREPHEACIKCHENSIDNNCEKCHDTKARAPFTHAQTGWALNEQHINLQCRDCHSSKGEFKRLSTNCTSCHSDWKLGIFQHDSAGLILDETHKEFECEECHIGRDFTVLPVCNNCHDEYSFPKNKPGKEMHQ
jgi:hypothetical protein